MAKSRRNRGATAHRKDPLAIKQIKPPSDPKLNALRQTKILPVIKHLCSSDPKARSAAASAVANIVHDEPCRKLLLREQIVHTLLTQTLTDAALESRAAGWGILQLLAYHEEADFCVHLFRLDILAAIAHAAKATLTTFSASDRPFLSRPKAEQAYVVSIAASLISLMTALVEAGHDIPDAVLCDQDLCRLVFFLVAPRHLSAQEAVVSLRGDALACLAMLCEDNTLLVRHMATDETRCLDALMALKSEDHGDSILACSVLHNMFAVLDAPENGPSLADANDAVLIPTLTKALSAVSPAQDRCNSSDWSSPVEQQLLALEILASVATNLSSSMYCSFSGQETNAPPLEDHEMNDADQDVSEDHDFHDHEMDEADMEADMQAVTGLDPDCQGIDDLPILGALLHVALPELTRIACMQPANDDARKLQSHALSALNNLAWSLSLVDFSQEHNAGIHRAWIPVATSLWEQVVSPLLAGDTANVALVTLLTGFSWALARSLQGKTPLKTGEHSRFIALYHATKGFQTESRPLVAAEKDPFQSLGVKCIGLVGQLALDPAPLHRNREIAVFLVTLIVTLPDTPTADVVEALNQLFDIYGDDAHACDVQVFWKDGLLAQLEAALPKVRAMARLVDKNAEPELRHRADEAALNLDRFLAYKRKHRLSRLCGEEGE